MKNIVKKLPNDVSRCGEYTYLLRYITADTPKVIVDLGAYGKPNSNSWNLICEHGWRGVLVEPRKQAAADCRTQFKGDFEVAETAVSDYEGTGTLHMFPWHGWSSLNPNHATDLGKPANWKCSPIPNIPVTTLPNLLDLYSVPFRFGVLSIDCESLDEKIITAMFSSQWRPEIIIIESCSRKVLEEAGYEILYYEERQQCICRLK
jgi:FkbM family methyltransferase